MPTTVSGDLSPAPFGRVLTAMLTPFGADGDLDLDAAQHLAAHRLETLVLGVGDHVLHHQPAEAVTFKMRARQDGELAVLAA